MRKYAEYQKRAYSKIKQYGSPITIKRAGKMVYDKTTNTYTDSGEEYTGYAIQSSFDQKNIDGTNIKFGDILLMCSLSGVPKSNDTVTFGSKAYTVIAVDVLSPDGATNILYNIQCR